MKIAIIGAGNMGSAIAIGLARSHGFNSENLAVSNRSFDKLETLAEICSGIYTSTNNLEVINDADLIILAVKPWILESVVREIAPRVNFSCQMLMSLAAGVSLETIHLWIADYTSEEPILFRCMPNTAISVGSSMTFISAMGATDDEIDDVRCVFDLLGHADVIPENLLPAATALCSCGIAYVMRYIRAAQEGAVELGFYPERARDYILQTMLGAVKLLNSTGNNPEVEIDKVTTPGGVTIRGLNAMEEAGFSKAVIKGLRASSNT